VTNLENGRTVVVRVNDRGPFVGTRIIDLSRRAAEVLGYKARGKAKVKVEYLGPAPLGDDRKLLARLNGMKTAPKSTLVAAISGRQTPRMARAPATDRRWRTARTASRSGERESYYLQVASFGDPERAWALKEGLRGYRGAVEVVPAMVNGRRYWRVRMGPFASLQEAEQAAGSVARMGMADARVVSVRPTGG